MEKTQEANQKDKNSTPCITGTGSRSQDALRAGYDTTCAKGVAVLLGVDDITVEECKKFIPRAKEEAEKKIQQAIKRNNEWCATLIGKRYDDCALYDSDDWRRLGRFKRLKERFKFWRNPPTKPYLGELKALEPEIQLDGNIKVVIHQKSKDGEWRYYDTVHVTAKRGNVVYESFDLYNKTYIPDECICEVKHAMSMGMEKIQVAYPVVQDVKKSDPIIVGYIGEQMYFIAKYDEYAKVLLKGKDIPKKERACTA